MPTVLPSSSTPVNELRFHCPARRLASAAGMCRAAASSSATACSAAETMFEVGALTTITPRAVAAGTSMLSRPTPARATTLSRVEAAERLGVDLGGRAHEQRVGVGDRGQQRGAVGAVHVADLDVVAQQGDRGRRELLGEQDDRAGGGGAHGGFVLPIR